MSRIVAEPVALAGPTTLAEPASLPPLRLAYLMSRFPKATETFILNEILELERLGHRVEIFPLVLEHEAIVQPGAAPLVARARDLRPWTRSVVAAQVYWLRRSPRTYLGSWVGAIRGTIRSPRFLLRALAAVPAGAAIARVVVDGDLHHIHAHWATHPTLAAWTAARLSGRPYSFTAHAHDIYVERVMLDRKIRDAAAVVTISETNRRLLEGWYGDDARRRTKVIHCGVDPAIFAPPPSRLDDARQVSAADGRPIAPGPRTTTIACVASLQPQKGQRFLIEACALAVAAGRSIRCVLIGEGSERPTLEQLIAERGLQGVVELVGVQSRDRVAALIGEADIVVQPSVVLATGKTEGIPVALMEAMASARAVIASDVSGIPELVVDGRTGLLVRPGDAPAIAAAIGRLIDDPTLAAELGSAGRQRVLDEFDLQRTTAQLVEVFRAAIAGRSARP